MSVLLVPEDYIYLLSIMACGPLGLLQPGMTALGSATAPYFYGYILLRALKSKIIFLLTYVYKK